MSVIDELAEQILSLTVVELAALNRRLRDAGMDGLSGVREPVSPRPLPTLGESAQEGAES